MCNTHNRWKSRAECSLVIHTRILFRSRLQHFLTASRHNAALFLATLSAQTPVGTATCIHLPAAHCALCSTCWKRPPHPSHDVCHSRLVIAEHSTLLQSVHSTRYSRLRVCGMQRLLAVAVCCRFQRRMAICARFPTLFIGNGTCEPQQERQDPAAEAEAR